MDIQQFKIKYIEDALGLLDRLDDDLIELEKNPLDQEYIERVFRVMHTLKGTSGMYGFDYISELTHELENIFNLVRDKAMIVTTEIFNLTLASGDHIRTLLKDETLSDQNNQKTHKRLKEEINKIISKSGNAPLELIPIRKIDLNTEQIRTWQILFTPSEEIVHRSINILYTLSDLLSMGESRIQTPDENGFENFWSIFLVTDKTLADLEDALIFVMDYCKIQLIANFDIFKEEELDKRAQTFTNDQSVEIDDLERKTEVDQKHFKIEKMVSSRILVEASKLDHLMFLVSELVTTKSELMLALEMGNMDKTVESSQKIDKLSKLFRDNALDIRLISMLEMTMRFKRLVRDLSSSLGKKVEFETHGEDVELDKNIIDCIGEPIMHLIRNCIDHGIETPEEREAAEKPETGIIKFFAYKSGNFVFIQISDDGRGINREKVTRKAVERGLIAENAQLTQAEVHHLIFHPGFSTAENLTQVSGRGVGMDIVRKKLQEIRGEISVDSEEGLGTSFTMKLQQTISIIDTLLIRSGSSKFAIPLEEVENCQIQTESSLLSKHNKQIIYKEELIPYISLREEFAYTSDLPAKQRIVVVNKYEKRFAIVVDSIIGEYQAVVKPIGSMFSEIEFVSGASILGDGSIALLLDNDKLKSLIVHN